MRVIAGKARSLPLKTVDDPGTRPTLDRTKETLFNVLQTRIYNARFLDLFSGSGAIGIEALSRGAKEAVFVENNKKALQYIRENLAFTGLCKNATVLGMDVMSALKKLELDSAFFDIVFMDPPFNRMLEKNVIKYLQNSSLTDRSSLVIAEASKTTDFSYLKEFGFEIFKTKNYKTCKHVFIRRIPGGR